MNNLKRLITAAVILPLFFAYIYLMPSSPYFLGLLIIASMITMGEFYTMYRISKKLSVPGILIGGALFYISCLYPSKFLDAIFLSLFLLLFIRLVFSQTPSGTMSEIGPLGVGFFYIAGFLSFQWFLISEVGGSKYIVFLYASVWMADSAAYYIGTYLGRNKLCPAISPNKTFEGVFSSIIGGILGAVIVRGIFKIPELTVISAGMVGAVLGVAAVIGDLIGSMFKRDAGVKDSSSLIPGHGGMLDKIDSILIAGPVLYIIYNYFLSR